MEYLNILESVIIDKVKSENIIFAYDENDLPNCSETLKLYQACFGITAFTKPKYIIAVNKYNINKSFPTCHKEKFLNTLVHEYYHSKYHTTGQFNNFLLSYQELEANLFGLYFTRMFIRNEHSKNIIEKSSYNILAEYLKNILEDISDSKKLSYQKEIVDSVRYVVTDRYNKFVEEISPTVKSYINV